MAAKRPRPKKAKTSDGAGASLLPSPRTPALVTRAAFGAALALLGCRADRSHPPMPAPPMNMPGPTGAMTAVSEEAGEAAFRPEAGAPEREADAATTTATDAGASAAKLEAAPTATSTSTGRPPMVRPPPPMVRPPMPPMVAPPPHPAPPRDAHDRF